MANVLVDKLRIDEDYLASLTLNDWIPRLQQDLSHLCSSDQVILVRPRTPELASLYSDIRSYVATMSMKYGYSIKTQSSFDIRQISAVLGYDNVAQTGNTLRFNPNY